MASQALVARPWPRPSERTAGCGTWTSEWLGLMANMFKNMSSGKVNRLRDDAVKHIFEAF